MKEERFVAFENFDPLSKYLPLFFI